MLAWLRAELYLLNCSGNMIEQMSVLFGLHIYYLSSMQTISCAYALSIFCFLSKYNKVGISLFVDIWFRPLKRRIFCGPHLFINKKREKNGEELNNHLRWTNVYMCGIPFWRCDCRMCFRYWTPLNIQHFQIRIDIERIRFKDLTAEYQYSNPFPIVKFRYICGICLLLNYLLLLWLLLLFTSTLVFSCDIYCSIYICMCSVCSWVCVCVRVDKSRNRKCVFQNDLKNFRRWLERYTKCKSSLK